MSQSDPREVALGIILEYDQRDAFLNAILSKRLASSALERRDRAFVTELVQGTVRMRLALDHALGQFSQKPLDSLDKEVLWILRLAAYQMLYMNTPPYAVGDTSLRLAKKVRFEHAGSFVNALIRALAQGRDNIVYPEKNSDPEGFIESFYSHPRWIANLLIDQFGIQRAFKICEANNSSRPVSLRVNLTKAKREEIAEDLIRIGAKIEFSKIAPECILVRGGGDLASLEHYKKGLFSFQDEGSSLVGHALCLESGMSVLDLCAAPGGKANHAAELMKGKGRVVAIDINPSRVELIRGEAKRLESDIVEAFCMDARKVSESLEERFERVLLDAPCSGLGTLSRRPDLRWRRSPESIDGLVQLQKELIREAGKVVSPEGLLVYSTCTITRQENEEVVEWFLRNFPDFESFCPGDNFPGIFSEYSTGNTYIRLFPDVHGCDGMFIAVLRRMK